MQVYSNTQCVAIHWAFSEQVGVGHSSPEIQQHLKVLELSPDDVGTWKTLHLISWACS